jgi:hypothetical protein
MRIVYYPSRLPCSLRSGSILSPNEGQTIFTINIIGPDVLRKGTSLREQSGVFAALQRNVGFRLTCSKPDLLTIIIKIIGFTRGVNAIAYAFKFICELQDRLSKGHFLPASSPTTYLSGVANRTGEQLWIISVLNLKVLYGFLCTGL